MQGDILRMLVVFRTVQPVRSRLSEPVLVCVSIIYSSIHGAYVKPRTPLPSGKRNKLYSH